MPHAHSFIIEVLGGSRRRLGSQLLFIIFVVVAVVLSQVAVLVDRQLELSWASTSALALGVDGSRGLLTVIGGSVLGVAATAFSITISVIATASYRLIAGHES